MAKTEFWLEYASTYSYLSVARIGKLATRGGPIRLNTKRATISGTCRG